MKVVYVPAIRSLFTVPDHFAARDAAARIKWKQGLPVGTRIRAGVILAHIEWGDGPDEPVKAPAGCTGVIARKNGKIQHDMLHVRFQFLLEIRGA